MSQQTFIDTDGDGFVVGFDNKTGQVTFNTYVVFTPETGHDLTEFLVGEFNALTPEPLTTDVKPLLTATVTDGPSARENFNATAFQAAMDLDLSIEFKYAKSNTGNIEPRTLAHVERVFQTSEGHTVVGGYDEDREDYRTFRVDWVKGFVQVTD